jgi:hypothetical protein
VQPDCPLTVLPVAGSLSGSAVGLPLAGNSLRARERRLFWLLLAAWIINLFDLGLTLLAAEQRILVELNPVAAQVLLHGPLAVAVYKFALMVFGTAFLWHCRRHAWTEPLVWCYVLLCVALSFRWNTLYREAQPSWVQANTASQLLPDEYVYTKFNDQPRFELEPLEE